MTMYKWISTDKGLHCYRLRSVCNAKAYSYYLECAFCDCTIAENDDYSVYVPSPCIEPEPRCDICGESDDGNPPDWNGETGCHLSCEQVAEPYRVRLGKT